MQNSTPPNNSYSNAASAYGDNSQKHTPDQRELEARVLLKTANKMQELQNTWDPSDIARIDEVLKVNRHIWTLFFDAAIENKEGNRPDDLRSNILNLANFVFKRTVEILSDANPRKEKLDVLITINRDIAAGLMSRPDAGTPPVATSTSSTEGSRSA